MPDIDFIVEYFCFRFGKPCSFSMPDDYIYFKEEIYQSLTDKYIADLVICLYDLPKTFSFRKTILWLKDTLGSEETEILFNIIKEYFPSNTEIQFYPTYTNLLNQLEFNFEEQI